MKFSFIRNILFLLIALGSFSCGKENLLTTVPNEQIILIKDYQFTPLTLTVEPGDVIFFRNDDDVPHRILSQSAENIFDDTGEFDSLIIPRGVVGQIEIPSDAVSGSSFYFYDEILEDQMFTPSGILTVE